MRGLGEDHWRRLFDSSMKECHRVLKPGRWITLTYNDRETWPVLQDVMLDIGFIPDGSREPIAMETTAKSEKQGKGEDNTLRDLVINLRKPLAWRDHLLGSAHRERGSAQLRTTEGPGDPRRLPRFSSWGDEGSVSGRSRESNGQEGTT